MENQENVSYILKAITQINQNILVLSQNQTLMFEQLKVLNEKYTSLDQKIDDNYAKLDQKIDDNYFKLDEKIERNYASIIELQQNVSMIKKDIKDLRTDIDIVYDLENDSRKKMQKLL